MLKVMRHNAKYFYVLFVIVILSFIFWGIGTVDKGEKNDIVAEVGKDKISAREYWQTYERVSKFYREIYKDKFDDAMQNKLKLKENVLYSLIENRVLLAAARQNGVTVSDSELDEAIRNEPAFSKDGVFNVAVYQNRLSLSRLTPDAYEAAKREEMTAEKMRNLIELSIPVPDLPAAASADDQQAKALRDAMMNNERARAVKAYVAGLQKAMNVKIYSDRLS